MKKSRSSPVRGALRKAASDCVRHHGVSMNERAGCERGVDFVGRELRKRGLGHITEVEDTKVARALSTVRLVCTQRYTGKERETCLKAVQMVHHELRSEGFHPGSA